MEDVPWIDLSLVMTGTCSGQTCKEYSFLYFLIRGPTVLQNTKCNDLLNDRRVGSFRSRISPVGGGKLLLSKIFLSIPCPVSRLDNVMESHLSFWTMDIYESSHPGRGIVISVYILCPAQPPLFRLLT